MFGVMLALFFFRFYIWILIKLCGKRSRYCIQIVNIFLDINSGILYLTADKEVPIMPMVFGIVLILSGVLSLIIMIYINVEYRSKIKKEEEGLNSSLNQENDANLVDNKSGEDFISNSAN